VHVTSIASVLSTAKLMHANAITIPRHSFPIHALIAGPNIMGRDSRRIDMNQQPDRLNREREEIAARVANFKATQEKFEREREAYFFTTLENAKNRSNDKALWS
jgi:hypothetical protein